ncbi:hypothetical protein NB713_002084 [Xanthomonas sacchari]|nr:hypothetical protein [Xanthomonas sacchari]
MARAQASGRGQRGVQAGTQRGPGRDHGLGHAADQPVPRRARGWRVRHVVRQGAGRGPLRRRVQARQRRRHLAPWRRAGAGRRRPRLPQLDPAARLGGRVRQRDDAGAQSGRSAGHPRHGSARLGDEPLHRALDRLQDHRRDRGILGLGAGGSVRAADRAAGGFRAAAGRPQHPLAGSAAGPGNAPASLCGARGAGLRPRQRHRPHGDGCAAGAAGHRHHRQELPGRAAGAGIPGPGRGRLRAHRHPRVQGRHDLAAGAAGHRRVRARAAGHRRGGGEEGLHRAADEGTVLQLAGQRRPAPEHRRQVRRGRRMDPAVHRRTDPGHHRRGDRPAHPAPAAVGRGEHRLDRAAAALDGSQGSGDGAAARQLPTRAALLLGLPAQHLHGGAGGLARARRHRLPLHGDVDGPRHRHLHPHGRRRRHLGRAGAVHRHPARVPEPGRRHLFPQRLAGDPPVDRRRGQHHLQDPLQRRGGDDRRAAGGRHPQRARHRPADARRGRAHHRPGQRRHRQVDTAPRAVPQRRGVP